MDPLQRRELAVGFQHRRLCLALPDAEPLDQAEDADDG